MHRAAHLSPPRPRGDAKALRLLRWTLLSLVLVLTFEGLLRKLDIQGTSLPIFFLKDAIVLAMGAQILRLPRPPVIDFLWYAYLVEVVLFMPLVLTTASNDFILALFGTKQYLLYPLVGFSVYFAFEQASVEEVTRFFRWLALLVLPTSGIALLQLNLPTTNWLNLSVGGSSLEGFSAAGHLRVSSTFSFVAQYCSFLNTEVFIVFIALCSLGSVKQPWKVFYYAIVPLLIIGSYVTGSRGAVLVNGAIVVLGAMLSLLKLRGGAALRIFFVLGGILAALVVSKYLYPQAFAAYTDREQGQLIGVSSASQERIAGTLFNWTGDVFSTPFFGNGLGIMSNGSEQFSRFAAVSKSIYWTETDAATTLYEGGLYLVIIWYGFRLFVIYHVVSFFLKMRESEFGFPNAFCVASIIILGLTGTLGIQPPVAIWWWLSVGTALVLWKKSVQTTEDLPISTDIPSPSAEKKIRGQSAYAQRLHGRK